VIAKQGSVYIMVLLPLLIVELKRAERELRKTFEIAQPTGVEKAYQELLGAGNSRTPSKLAKRDLSTQALCLPQTLPGIS
jgi:hypothetical protein